MTAPLKLPLSVKKMGRLVRDFPPANNLITSVVRPALRALPPNVRESVMAHLPRVGKAQARLPNGRTLQMSCPQTECILNGLFYKGWTADEAEVLPLWFALAQNSRVVVDVGAHVGHFSLVAGLANPEARIFGFEPLPRVAALLRSNVQLNRLSNAEIRQCALGRAPGKLPFYAPSDGIPSSSSLSREFMLSGGHTLTETVIEVSTLDTEPIPTDGPVIIKIDTESTEPDVIAGGKRFIRDAQPLMIIEVLDGRDTGDRLARELADAGYAYTPYLLTGAGPARRDRLVGDPEWRNYLLVPTDISKIGPLIGVLNQFGITDSW